MQRNKTTVESFSGSIYDFSSEKLSQPLSLKDIAISLSKQCRFNGSITKFYSVAEHCCILYDSTKGLSDVLSKMLLLHDAAEVFISDIPTPIKNVYPDIRKIEDNIQYQIYEYYNIPIDEELLNYTKSLDKLLLTYEKKFFGRLNKEIYTNVTLFENKIKCWNHKKAYREFLERLYDSFSDYVPKSKLFNINLSL